MWQRAALVSLLSVGLAGCAPLGLQQGTESRPTLYPQVAFSHRVGTQTVNLYCNCQQPDQGVLRLEGVVQSPHISGVQSVEFDLVGVDANERVISAVQKAPKDFILGVNQISPFQLDLRMAGSERRFNLYYRYRPLAFAKEGAGGVVLACDVCSESQPRTPRSVR